MDTTVSHYGIHMDDEGVSWLEQGRSGVNALGLRRKSPFKVELANRKRHCNHAINIASPIPDDKHWQTFEQLRQDDLVTYMLPVPKADGGLYVVREDPRILELVSTLARMSSPIHHPVVPYWTVTSPQAIVQELGTTNVQPLVLSGVEAKHSNELADICSGALYAPRKLLILASRDFIKPPQALELDTQFRDPSTLNLEVFKHISWESIGAQVVKRYMRRDRF